VISVLKEEFLKHLDKKVEVNHPKNLYEPIAYILGLGGKKIRPLLTLLSADAFGIDYKKALDAALAIELFHNFTLIHDDIMDAAPLRRGNITVHKKWGINRGILSGDAMMVLAYQNLEAYNDEVFKKLNRLFSKTALEVCDGQQLDVDFETRSNVTVDEYIEMISLKTSVLVGCALKFGAVIANASDVEADKIYKFGLNLGIAFQLQDDYLDTFGNSKSFGKQVGGDIIENKKTLLFLTALKLSNNEDKEKLRKMYAEKHQNNDDKVLAVIAIFNKYEVPSLIKQEIEKYTKKSFEILETVNIPDEKKQMLYLFGENLMNRNV